MKIKTVLTLWFTILVTVLFVISDFIVFYGIKNYLYEQKSDEIKERVHEVEKVANALAIDKKDLGEKFNINDSEILSYTLSEQGTTLYEGAYLQLTKLENNTIFSRSPTLKNSELPILKQETLGPLTILLPIKEGRGLVKILYYSTNIEVENKSVANVQIGLPLTRNEKLLNNIIFFMILQVFISILISIFFGVFLSKKALTPMVKITNKVHSMEGNDLLSKLDTSIFAKDEIGALADTFNRLIERISIAFEFQKRFISDSSHELRSPLTTIKGYTQLIIKRGSEKPEIIKEGLEVIEKESTRLEKLVNDMLNISKTGKKHLEFLKINLNKLIEDLYKELSKINNKLYFKNINQNFYIMGDADSLKRVFINLIDNASRAIDIENGEIIISLKKENNTVIISIKDNGIGISEEHIKHIFERFYRVDSARARNKGGSGLGLALVKEIVENHNGSISVKSKENEGSEFIIVLNILEE
ncbi:MAG: HAMP domain-containing sensor histidine kinase [Candidatus Sericytochromatia bacterium]